MSGYGAASVDASWSDTDLASGENKRGASVRFLCSKSLNTLGTDVQIAGYRYSTSGFYDFSDAVAERNNWQNGFYHTQYYDQATIKPARRIGRRKTSAVVTTTRSSTTTNARRDDGQPAHRRRFAVRDLYPSELLEHLRMRPHHQTGFNTTWNRVSVGVFYQNSRSNYGYSDNSVNLNVSVPINIFGPDHESTVNFNASNSKQSGSGYSAGMSGTLVDDNRMNYFVPERTHPARRRYQPGQLGLSGRHG